MLPESISYPKSRIVSISIFLSLVLHSLLLYVQLQLLKNQSSLPAAALSLPAEKFIKPMLMIAPPGRRTPATPVSALPMPARQPISRLPVAQALPPSAQQEQPQFSSSGHRVHRVGTGFDAPDTDQALALGKKTPDGRGGTGTPRHAAFRRPMPMQPPTQSAPVPQAQPAAQPTQRVGHATRSTQKIVPNAAFEESMPGRIPIYMMGAASRRNEPADTGVEESMMPAMSAVQQQTAASSATPQQAPVQAALSFLSPQQFTERMRQDILADGDDRPAGGIGVPGHSGGVAQQYGDPKYLHYNSKVYTAITQSMDVILAQLSQNQYRALLDGVTHPARVRFALDSNGKPSNIRISLSSNNQYYDTLVLRIIAEASFPSIPRSFDMRTTFHNYGLILYNDGSLRDHIGVSPYIEGE